MVYITSRGALEDGCIDLLTVMRIMNQLDQEQVWALAYELAALMQRLWPAGNCALIENLAQIYIHQDGFIHEKSLLLLLAGSKESTQVKSLEQASKHLQQQTTTTTKLSATNQQEPQLETQTKTKTNNNNNNSRLRASNNEQRHREEAATNKKHQQQQQQLPLSPPITPELDDILRRRPALSESELVASLGDALYRMLDYDIPDDEERELSMTMEYLIFRSQSDDLTLAEVLEICIRRLPIGTKANVDCYYRGLCKSLVSDTIELSIFLDKIYTATMELGGVVPSGGTATRTSDPLTKSKAASIAHLDQHELSKLSCDKILLNHHHHLLSHQQLVHVDHEDLNELGLPLASLRALKIDEWARLWMQVIKEMRQRSKFIKCQAGDSVAPQPLAIGNF